MTAAIRGGGGEGLDTIDVVTLGECLLAFVAAQPGPLAENGSFLAQPAGAEANVAVGLARLGRRVAYVGRVGDDGPGLIVLRRLRAEGVDVARLTVTSGRRTALLVRERRTLGAAEVVYHRDGSAGSLLSGADVEAAIDLVRRARWLHVSGVTPALSDASRGAVDRAFALAVEHAVGLSLDLNIRRKLWPPEEAAEALRPLVPRTQVVLGDLEECALVAGTQPEEGPESAARALVDLGAACVVVKLGAVGAIAMEQDGAVISAPAFRVTTPLDPVGAGDAFAAGFLTGCLDGVDLRRRLELANACGAFAVSSIGDMAGLPTTAELERFLDAPESDVHR